MNSLKMQIVVLKLEWGVKGGTVKLMLNSTFKINVSDEVDLFCDKGLFGMVHVDDSVIIEPRYQYISSPNSHGLCLIEDVDGCFGYMNLKGEDIIPACFDYVGVFIGDLCLVVTNEAYGVFNHKGEEIVPATYDAVKIEPTYITLRYDNLWGAALLDGRTLYEVMYATSKDLEAVITEQKAPKE